MNINRVSFDML